MSEDNNTKKLKLRSEIPAEYKWNTDRIYKTTDEWNTDFEQIKALLADAEKYRGHLKDGADLFYDALLYQEKLSRLIDRVYLFASMKRDEDNTATVYQELKGRIQALLTEAETVLSFFSPELLALPEAVLESYISDPRIKPYEKSIRHTLRYRPYVLSEREEELIALAGDVTDTASEVFSMLNNADLEFPKVPDGKGEMVELSHGNYIPLMESGDREVRRAAFTALYETYGKYKNTIAASLSGSVKKDIFYARAHNYSGALFASLYSDNVSVAVYEQLIETIHQSLPAFFRYLEMRKKMLGIDELHMYDVYAPLVKEDSDPIGYEDALKTVAAALAPLGEQYVSDMLSGVKNDGWADVCESKGKTSGAYSSGCYDTSPYILLNHQDDLNSVFTLAHELGHSMHSYYSWRTQPYTYAYYRIFVAEVASTVNEILLANYLLNQSASDSRKLNIINRYLETFRGTVFRQTMFAEFEKLIHEAAEQGSPLTAENLSNIYYGLNKKYFGDGIISDERIALEWARIPHFYNNFYVYKYATGFSAAQSLASAILAGGAEGEAARKRYLEFLSSGGSDDPLVLLRCAGVDMESQQPVKDAVAEFSRMLDEFCLLANIK